MSAIEHEIASQPTVWAEAAATAVSQEASLPEHGSRLLVIGCGTSLYMAQAFAHSRESAGLGETDAYPASELPVGRRYDSVLAISRSGTTTEVLEALTALEEFPRTLLTAVADSPLAAAATRTIALPFADERSVVQTRFATAALVLLRRHLGWSPDVSIEAAKGVIAAPPPDDPDRFDRVCFLGHGWTVGLAHEAALKMREAALAWSESYPAREYRHGPISLADPHTAVWLFGPPDPALVADVARTGATVVHEPSDPLALLVAAQRTAVAVATARGLDPDAPRNLTRSVVLS
jgi:fructoselysine-6-P-deglycase FrlB-like protein